MHENDWEEMESRTAGAERSPLHVQDIGHEVIRVEDARGCGWPDEYAGRWMAKMKSPDKRERRGAR